MGAATALTASWTMSCSFTKCGTFAPVSGASCCASQVKKLSPIRTGLSGFLGTRAAKRAALTSGLGTFTGLEVVGGRGCPADIACRPSKEFSAASSGLGGPSPKSISKTPKAAAQEVAAPPVASDESETSDLAVGDDSEATIKWAQNWYPVSPVIDMDPAVPYPFEVVFWYSPKEQKWSCVDDRCPHRLAPLSEGRVDPASSTLQCSYHAWSFRSDGSCASIPQLADAASALGNKRSCATVLPVQVAQGMLFVWADPATPDLAQSSPLPITPGMDDAGWASVGTFRDLEYGWDTGLENLVDPAHVCVAHSNVNGGLMGTRADARPLALALVRQGSRGFEGQMAKAGGAAPTRHVFDAPARFTYDFEARFQAGARGMVTTYCTPLAPGRCRINVVNARNFMLQLSSGPNWWQLMPRWYDHQLMLNLLDGDASLLHRQERELAQAAGGEASGKSGQQAQFMPAGSDTYVIAFRKWLSRFGGGRPEWAPGIDPALPPLITDRTKLLDRYHSHTKQCTACSAAHANFQKAQGALYASAAALVGLGAVCEPAWERITLVMMASIAATLGWKLTEWIQMFEYKGWDHARNP
eukprot:jgi/Mesen1/4631/ME000239S03902